MEMQEKLEKLGLTHWTKGEYDRTYINKCNLKDVFDVLKCYLDIAKTDLIMG